MKVDFTGIKVMFDEEVFCFDVFRLFGAGDAAIPCKRESAHVVLVDDIIRDCVTLGFKEMACPKDVTGFIMHSNKLGFSRTFGVDFLFVR